MNPVSVVGRGTKLKPFIKGQKISDHEVGFGRLFKQDATIQPHLCKHTEHDLLLENSAWEFRSRSKLRRASKWKEMCNEAGGCCGLKERGPVRTHIQLNAQRHRKARTNLGDSMKSHGSTLASAFEFFSAFKVE